jgi:hypothetical protein
MNTLQQWKNNAIQFAESHEREITCLLVLIAVILILVAIFGKAHHKAMAMVYIVL